MKLKNLLSILLTVLFQKKKKRVLILICLAYSNLRSGFYKIIKAIYIYIYSYVNMLSNVHQLINKTKNLIEQLTIFMSIDFQYLYRTTK